MSVRLITLGRCAVVVNDRVIGPTSELLFAGALLLGLERGRTLSRTEIIDLLWPGAAPDLGSGRLRWLLSQLRRAGVPLQAYNGSVQLSRGLVTWDWEPSNAGVDDLGPVLPGYRPTFSRPFERWVERQREKIAETTLRNWIPQLSTAREFGDWTRAATLADALRRVDPLNEEAALTLAEAQCRLGAKAQALAGLDHYLAALGEDRAELRVSASVLRRRIAMVEDKPARFGEAKFVGRQEQLRMIDDLFREANRGHGGALCLCGPAGIGKTRLLDEAATRAVLSGMRVARVRCQAADALRPLSGLMELIPVLLALPGAAGIAPEHLKQLEEFAQIQEHASEDSPRNPVVVRRALCLALLDLLDAVTSEAPLLIEFDDVQWIDPSLSWFWENVFRWSADHSVAWLFGYRTTHSEAPTIAAPVVWVGSLDTDASALLLDDLVERGYAKVGYDARGLLLARGAGSPLFIRELARQWTSSGTIDRLPASLTTLLENGLDTLSRASVRVLQVAGLLESHANLERVESVANLAKGEFTDAVAELQTSGILAAGENGATTGHVLWAEAALRRLPSNVAAVLHRHAAEMLDSELAVRPSMSILWECARHWKAAGYPDRARAAAVRGAEQLARTGFPDSAAGVYHRLSNDTHDAKEELTLLRHCAELLDLAARWEKMGDVIRRHEAVARDLEINYDVHNDLELIQHRVTHFQAPGSEEGINATLACARDIRATTTHRLAAARFAAALAEPTSIDAVREAFVIASGLEARTARERRDLGVTKAIYYMRFGDPREAVTVIEPLVEEIRSDASSANPVDAIRVLERSGVVYRLVGRIADAREAYREAGALAWQHGALHWILAFYGNEISVSLEFDTPDVAHRSILKAKRIVSDSWLARSYFAWLSLPAYEAELAILQGRAADALQLAPTLDKSLELPVKRWRVRLLAIQLAARILLGRLDQCGPIAAAMCSCFDEADLWRDWAAVVFADYLQLTQGRDAAASFARHFVSELRRELFPPPRSLRDLASVDIDGDGRLGTSAFTPSANGTYAASAGSRGS